MFVYPHDLVCSLYSATEHILQTSVSQGDFLPLLHILVSTSPSSLWAFHSAWWAISHTIKMRRAQVALSPGNGLAQREAHRKKSWFKNMCIHTYTGNLRVASFDVWLRRCWHSAGNILGGESLPYLFIINSASMGSILLSRHGMNWKAITKPGLKRRHRELWHL